MKGNSKNVWRNEWAPWDIKIGREQNQVTEKLKTELMKVSRLKECMPFIAMLLFWRFSGLRK